MSNLETTFAFLEEIEAMEQYLVEELESIQRKTHRSRLAQECRIANVLLAATHRAKRIKFDPPQSQGGFQAFLKRKDQLPSLLSQQPESYLDNQAAQTARICAWGGTEFFGVTEEEERVVFRPKNRMERRLSRAKIDEFVIERTCSFTGEESLGRFLDLHALHLMFQNLHSGLRSVSYLDYLRKYVYVFPPPGVIVETENKEYGAYLFELKQYLIDFELRARPLTVCTLEQEELSFQQELQAAKSAKDLEKLTMQELKQALMDRGLKHGGSLSQRAQRLFAVQQIKDKQDYPIELLASHAAAAAPISRVCNFSAEEAKIKQVLLRLQTICHATVTMITKKLTMTYSEVEQERQEALMEEAEKSDQEQEADDEEEDGSKFQLNGKIDPGTGRLIPKWMYRLHGLNQEFKCEICGNQSYFGRRAYERHFKDFRHANGMKALGIPNSSHFLDITSISDALNLYASLKHDMEKSEFQRQSEEFEDAEGNVMTRKMFEDLKREGLV